MISPVRALIGGFPRIGENRELKKALESYWKGDSDRRALERTAAELRERHWKAQREAGLEVVCVNDFSLYDQMLDTAVMLGAIPPRFRSIKDPLDRYFAMARGKPCIPPLAMKKWFNTNYHYFVPELESGQAWELDAAKPLAEAAEARALGFRIKFSLIGPLTFLRLSRVLNDGDQLRLLPSLLPVYEKLLASLAAENPDAIIQIDEPILVKDPDLDLLAACRPSYAALCEAAGHGRILVSTYFDHAAEALPLLAGLPFWGIGLDFVYGEDNLRAVENWVSSLPDGRPDFKLVAGVVDGRNVWARDRSASESMLDRLGDLVGGDQVIPATSCSLLHVPYRAATETALPAALRARLAFAHEKLAEVAALGNREPAARGGSVPVRPLAAPELEQIPLPPARTPDVARRRLLQKDAIGIPSLPTTTIGSFPQTAEIRSLRSGLRAGKISAAEYEKRIKEEIASCVRFQEEIGLDVLVHGEFERTDMVEFFAEKLDGFAFTANGWVQSYGSRCVKPPIIHGPVSRPRAMTVDLIAYAQSLTKKPMKGMLTGPVTILNWSFVRRDVPRSRVCMEIAEALKQEVLELEAAGIKIIQVDEAAFKEGYPLRGKRRAAYERMAVAAFRTATGAVESGTQIHSHMCYSEFADIMDTLNAMDADVLSIETTRDGDRLLEAFRKGGYEGDLGPGIYDIHSPAVPDRDELVKAIRSRLELIGADRLWVNPDCGLKTRGWAETGPSLRNLVEAAREARLGV